MRIDYSWQPKSIEVPFNCSPGPHAMAAGVPVINTDLNSGVPEVSLDGITGITVPPEDANALAQAINMLLENAALRKSMGEAGRVRAHREFEPGLMIERTMKLYEEVLLERQNRRSLTC